MANIFSQKITLHFNYYIKTYWIIEIWNAISTLSITPPLPSSRCMPAYQVINLSKMTDTYTLLYMFQWLVLCKHQNIRHKFCYYYFDLSTQKILSKVKKSQEAFFASMPKNDLSTNFQLNQSKNWKIGI